MKRLARGRAFAGLVLAFGLSGPALGDVAADRQALERILEAKGLKRVGSTFVAAAEGQFRDRLGRLESLVTANQAALGRRQLRTGIAAQTNTIFLDLSTQQIVARGLFWGGIYDPYIERQATLLDLIDLTSRQITGLTNLAAGLQVSDAADAADALARQDDFARGLAALQRSTPALGPEYDRFRRDLDVQAALARLTRLENRPITLGPAEDYSARLDTLATAMDQTRTLTTQPGRSAPNYATAALLAEASRRDLRLALGRLDEARRKSAPIAQIDALEEEIAGRLERFVRSAAVLRRSYDAMPPAPEALPVAPNPPDVRQIGAMVEKHRAGMRTAYVAEIERAIRTARQPVVSESGAWFVVAAINGRPGRRVRLDRAAARVVVPERTATELGITPDPAATTGSTRLSSGQTAAGRLALARAIQVGPFTAERVPVLVVPGEGPVVLPGAGALGTVLTALEESDGATTLVLTRVDLTPLIPRPLPPGTPPPKEKRPPDPGLPKVDRELGR